MVNGYPVLGGLEDLNAYPTELYVALGVGDPKTKEHVVHNISNDKLSFPNLIHPAVICDYDSIAMGKGNIICAGTILTVNIVLKDYVTLNLSCTVGHDTFIDSYVSCMPAVNISGEVNVHKSVYIGTGAKVINDVSIGSNTIIGAGAMVAKSLPENCTAVGIPAKPIKFHESAKK
jgi:sugar O-acyltransferase (sialic acid O-acetyltransferase NeuD family)